MCLSVGVGANIVSRSDLCTTVSFCVVYDHLLTLALLGIYFSFFSIVVFAASHFLPAVRALRLVNFKHPWHSRDSFKRALSKFSSLRALTLSGDVLNDLTLQALARSAPLTLRMLDLDFQPQSLTAVPVGAAERLTSLKQLKLISKQTFPRFVLFSLLLALLSLTISCPRSDCFLRTRRRSKSGPICWLVSTGVHSARISCCRTSNRRSNRRPISRHRGQGARQGEFFAIAVCVRAV